MSLGGRADVAIELGALQLASCVDQKFDTSQGVVTAIWHEMQREQVDFAFALELPSYYDSAAWRHARTVLDVGTGNGWYLRRLAEHFPDKRYRGIDTSAELIALATPSERVHFVCGDADSEVGPYDAAVVRLLLQHLPEPERVLTQLGAVTASGGVAFVIDACDSFRAFVPEVPSFMELFHAYTEQEAARGRRRDVGSRAPALATATGQWRVDDVREVLIPSTVPGNLRHFRRIYGLFLDLVERTGIVACDFDRVRDDWHAWCERRDAYAQVGISIVRLLRR